MPTSRVTQRRPSRRRSAAAERRRRRVDAGERVGRLAASAGCSARARARRTARRTGWPGVRLSWSGRSHVQSSLHRGRNVLNSGDEDAEARARRPAPAAGSRAGRRRPRRSPTTTRLKKSAGRQRVEPRGDEHAGQPGEERRQRPGERRHPVGGDAVQLGHPRALDDRPHPQADRGEPEQRAERRACRRRRRPWPPARCG